jgi:hydrogenase maturation protease
MENNPIKILIAGMGNELRQDDAFGMILARKLLDEAPLPPYVQVLEAGSAGIHLVQQLYDRYDILIILDTVQWGDPPGTISLKEAQVKDIRQMASEEKNHFLADMHYISPLKALMMAKALDIIPDKVYFLGCEAEDHEDIDVGMSPVVSNAIQPAFSKITEWINYIISKEKASANEGL